MIRVFELDKMSVADRRQIFERAQTDIAAVRDDVQRMIDRVRSEGDAALVDYTKKFDDSEFTTEKLVVSKEEIAQAYDKTGPEIIARIREQINFSTVFHKKQREQLKDWEMEIAPGVTGGEKWTPLDRVGLYIPGGKNPFPTVQQILAVPAKAAGCPSIASCISPRGRVEEVLIAANEVGVTELYRVSGPWAIAAMAYGTESIKAVELIAGPGSPPVTAAKILCQERCAIDMPAGPSEAIILADESTTSEISLERKAVFCAADILARAEHGPDSAGVLVTNSKKLAELTAQEIERQKVTLARREYIDKALQLFSAILVTKTFDDAIEFTNQYAPEHLEIIVENPRAVLAKIRNAGSAFLGYWDPVATGDYAIGVNHILPTGGWARRTSAVAVWTFMKRVQYSEVTKPGLKLLQPIVQCISDVEGLDAHKRSVDVRFE